MKALSIKQPWAYLAGSLNFWDYRRLNPELLEA